MAEQTFYASGSPRDTLKYLLDEKNSPVGFSIQYPGNASNYWQSYYFGKNLQGDVVNLYRSDPKGNSDVATLVATYRYDPWGKVQGIFKPNGEKIPETAVHVAAYNPFRYRGYRYDGDTGFYYLQSRYYDPEICRFISADSYASTGQGLLGHNMFVYCGNNPVNRTDPSGQFWGIVIGVTLVVGVVAALSGCSSKRAPTSNVGAAQPYVNMPGSSDRNSPNCYAYAIGSPVNEQPGARSGQTPSKWNDVDAVGKCVEADLESMNKTVRRIDGPDAKVYDNEFKIALRVGTKPYAYNQYSGELYYDYHFMRQTDTGQWAEKHGIGGGSVLWDVGMTPDTIPWTLNDKPYYDSPIIYYAVGN